MSSRTLSNTETWRIDFALSPEPHSPREAVRKGTIRQMAELGIRYGLTPIEAATFYIEDRELLADPDIRLSLRRSLQQMETGNLIEITDEDLAEVKARA